MVKHFLANGGGAIQQAALFAKLAVHHPGRSPLIIWPTRHGCRGEWIHVPWRAVTRRGASAAIQKTISRVEV